MKILVTGSAGFVGKNLVEYLKTIKDGRNKTRPNLKIEEIYEYDKDNTPEELDLWCSKTDFVFNLAGVNRPKNIEEFNQGNFGFASVLLENLKRHKNKAPVMLSSSIQASLAGRFGTSEYGISKKAGEDLFFDYGKKENVKVLVYRFPNLAGKWIRPNYNSAIGTFCHNIANDLPIIVNDPKTEIELLFIDDLIEELINALEGNPTRCDYPKEGEEVDNNKFDGLTPYWNTHGRYCASKNTHKVTLGEIVEILDEFKNQPHSNIMPELKDNSFKKKLFSMYLSYLPEKKAIYDLKMNIDDRGSFTELIKTISNGQFSVNISKPGVKKGEHWHNSKWELFIVVSGNALIQERKIGTDEIIEFEVSGDKIQAVYMLPGYTHNIINLSKEKDLVTLMWANELFNPNKPDTYFEPVTKNKEK